VHSIWKAPPPEGTDDDKLGRTYGNVVEVEERLGDADRLGFPEGEELGAFDLEGAPPGR
jgi:hypothetical protein